MFDKLRTIFMEPAPELDSEQKGRSELVQDAANLLYSQRHLITGSGADAERFESGLLPLIPGHGTVTSELGALASSNAKAAEHVADRSAASPQAPYLGAGAMHNTPQGAVSLNPEQATGAPSDNVMRGVQFGRPQPPASEQLLQEAA